MNTNTQPYLSKAAVFYSRKKFENGTMLEIIVDCLHIEGRQDFRFTVLFTNENEIEYAELDDVTSDRECAEKLFSLLTTGNVYPCHLNDIAEDFLISYVK